MSAAVAWSNVSEAAQVPEAAPAKLEEFDYVTQEAMEFKDEATFEAFAKYFALEVCTPGGVKDAEGIVEEDYGARASGRAGHRRAVPGRGPARGKSVTAIQRDEMLEKKWSSTLTTLTALLAMVGLSQVKAQFCSQAWAWIPWKKLLSEKMATSMKGRRKSRPQESFVEASACGIGFYEEKYDKDLSGAPYCIRIILQVRARVRAMVESLPFGELGPLQRAVHGVL